MIRINNPNQIDLFDPWDFLGPKRRRLLDESWAGLFRKLILPAFPVQEISPFYTEGNGRPTKELYTMVGVIFLQQMLDLRDKDCLQQLAFNTQWHFALNITEESDHAKYISLRSLERMRSLIVSNGLDNQIFDLVTKELQEAFSVDTRKQRLDSVKICSNMRKLARLTILSATTRKFLINLNRESSGLLTKLPEELRERYLSSDDAACFGLSTPSTAGRNLKQAAEDMFQCIHSFDGVAEVSRMQSYKLMKRVFGEQCKTTDSKDGPEEVTVKKPEEVPSSSVQNPSDPDAGYSKHKGQGYHVQVMETFSTKETPEERAQELNLITHVSAHPANEHDSAAVSPALNDTAEKHLAPETLLADTAYGGDENVREAKEKGTSIIAPVAGSESKDRLGLSDFSFRGNGHVLRCPMDIEPIEQVRNGDRFIARFSRTDCLACPMESCCPVKRRKEFHTLSYGAAEQRAAKRRRVERRTTFRKAYRYRAGVEATMSELDRRTGFKKLRYRGMGMVRFATNLKAAGVNILRAVAVSHARKQAVAA